MQALSFYLLYPFLRLLALLPLRVLYFLADFLVYPVLYGLLGYRKKVVRENMRRVYPEKTEEERVAIEKKFYHYLADLFMETVKGFDISFHELAERILLTNPELLQDKYKEKGGAIITLGHVGNYEWLAQYIPKELNLKMAVPYRKFTNSYFDKVFKASREQGGAVLFHTKDTRDYVRNTELPYVLALANDQSAPAEKSYWVKFLNQDTSFFEGTERMARQLGVPVVFLYIRVTGRGKYEVTFRPIADDPHATPLGQIMETHARFLEENIHEAPQYWLWSHKRWKHKKPEGFTYGFTRDILQSS